MVSFFSLLLLLLSGQNIPIDVDVDDVDDLDVVVVEDVSFNDVSSTSTVRTTFINWQVDAVTTKNNNASELRIDVIHAVPFIIVFIWWHHNRDDRGPSGVVVEMIRNIVPTRCGAINHWYFWYGCIWFIIHSRQYNTPYIYQHCSREMNWLQQHTRWQHHGIFVHIYIYHVATPSTTRPRLFWKCPTRLEIPLFLVKSLMIRYARRPYPGRKRSVLGTLCIL